MPKKTTEIKVRPSESEKALFERAAEADKRSLNQWVIVACLEKAERAGLGLDEPKKGSKGR